MVADHMLRAPAIQYRLQQERQRLAQQDALNQVRADDYKANARKTNAEAEDIEGSNAAKKWLAENEQMFEGLVDPIIESSANEDEVMERTAKVLATNRQLNKYARAYARAYATSMKDAMEGLVTAAAARKAELGAKPEEVAAMTPGSAASVRGAELRADATRDAAKIRAESGVDQPETDYEEVTEKYPEVPDDPGAPEVPAQYGWFGRKKADAIPAVPPTPGTPERTVKYKRKRGAIEDFAQSGIPGIPAANGDAGTDDDSDMEQTPAEAETPPMPVPQPTATTGTNAAPAKLPKVQSQADVDIAIADANDAIRGVGLYSGKPRSRKVVMERLKAMGIVIKE